MDNEDTTENVPTEPQEPSYGHKAVGSTVPSDDPQVQAVKKLYAEIIDRLNDSIVAVPSEHARLVEKAITEAQGACMWAVKAITWKG